MSKNFEKGSLSLDHLKIAEKLFGFYKREGFLKKHIDLFWEQWRLSYWFSFEHTSPDMRSQVVKEGKKFVEKHLEKYSPEDIELKNNIKGIFANKFIKAMRRGCRRIVVGSYEKVNIGYRQQKYINYNIERLQERHSNLAERVERLLNSEVEDEKKS